MSGHDQGEDAKFRIHRRPWGKTALQVSVMSIIGVRLRASEA
jgi:hypothetical protein